MYNVCRAWLCPPLHHRNVGSILAGSTTLQGLNLILKDIVIPYRRGEKPLFVNMGDAHEGSVFFSKKHQDADIDETLERAERGIQEL